MVGGLLLAERLEGGVAEAGTQSLSRDSKSNLPAQGGRAAHSVGALGLHLGFVGEGGGVRGLADAPLPWIAPPPRIPGAQVPLPAGRP